MSGASRYKYARRGNTAEHPWFFDGLEACYIAGVAGSAHDLSASNHGTLIGSNISATPQGWDTVTDSFIDLAATSISSRVAATGRFTILAVVYARTNVTWGTVLKNWADSEKGFAHFGFHIGTGTISSYLAESDGTQIGPSKMTGTLPLKEWVHLAVTADGTTQTVWQNGIAGTTTTTYDGTLRSCAPLAIAAKMNDAGTAINPTQPSVWDGLIDSISIHSRSLAADEIWRHKEIALDDHRSIVARRAYPIPTSTAAAATTVPPLLEGRIFSGGFQTMSGGM